jgi:hypothetical protein
MKVLKVVFIQLILFAVGIVGVELALAYFMPLPVHGGMYVDRKGDLVHLPHNELVLKANLDVTHVSSEFSSRIRTNGLGYRKIDNESDKPEVVFLGDSFTFGHGVTDQEVFPSIFCVKSNLTCQDLGRSGTDTFDQLRILGYALDHYGMRPKTVVVVVMAACALDSYGNDIGENHRHDPRSKSSALPPDPASAPRRAIAAASPAPAIAHGPLTEESLVKKLQRMLGNYEIAKRIMLIAASGLKRGLYRCSDDQQLETAIKATGAALAELEKMAAKFDFKVKVFTVHPYQELDGSFQTTEKYVSGVIPRSFEYFPTARRFRKEDYYAYDGHLNARGHATMAAAIEASLKNP